MRSSTEVDQERTVLEQQLRKAISDYETVSRKGHNFSRAILMLRIKKKDTDILIGKAKSNIRQLEIDISLKKSEFWSLKNENL